VENPPSKFRAGDAVDVIASDKFFIEEDGKKISKGYLATDLRAGDGATGNI
jgi:hypothetical protein